MTALECLSTALAALASRKLTNRDGAILTCLARFNGVTRTQIARITGMTLPIDAMRSLVEKGLVRVQLVTGKKNRHFVTEKGTEFIAQMLGRVPTNAGLSHGDGSATPTHQKS